MIARKTPFNQMSLRQGTSRKPLHQTPGVEAGTCRCPTAKAFSLIELLVVLSILAMLMGILMPALGAARRTAYRTGCKQNLHGCAIAFRIYLDENKNIMPTITNMPVSVPIANSAPIYTVLGKYLSGKEALKCPADKWPEKNSSYFREEGSSYEYNTYPPPFPMGPFNYQERKLEGKGITRPDGRLIEWADIYILKDYYGFHGKMAANGGWTNGAYTYLYADNLIADRERDK